MLGLPYSKRVKVSSGLQANFTGSVIIQMFIIKLRNWKIPFKLARLLVTHDGGKLTRVGELSLAERLRGG